MELIDLQNGLVFYTLPIFNISYFKYRKRILDKEFILKFRYNSEADFWSLGFYRLDETPILKSVKIRTGYSLISNYLYNLDLPQTSIICFNFEDDSNYPNQFDIDEKYSIGYHNIILE